MKKLHRVLRNLESPRIYHSHGRFPYAPSHEDLDNLLRYGEGMEELTGREPEKEDTLSHFQCSCSTKEDGFCWVDLSLRKRRFDPANLRWDLLAKVVQQQLYQHPKEDIPFFYFSYEYEEGGGGSLLVTRTGWFHVDTVLWTRERLNALFSIED